MTGAVALARAAQALVGCRFALHGRNRETGFDCVGVLAASLAATGRQVCLPNGYTMRQTSAAIFAAQAARCGLVPADGPAQPGDVLLFKVGPCQFHLGIAGFEGGLVHAHAGLRRVVISAIPDDWAQAGHWRLPTPN